MRAAARRRRALWACALGAALAAWIAPAATWLAPAAARQEPAAARQEPAAQTAPLWPAECAPLSSAARLGADRAEIDARAGLARECALAAELLAGPDDVRLPAFYDRLAGALGPKARVAASAALPYRRRAHRAAERLLGPDAPATGQAALDHARTWLLTGRCEGHDPRVLALLADAARGFRGGEASAARAGLKAVADGFADGLAYREAIAALLAAGGPDGAGLDDADWERLGTWRHRLGRLDEAAEAYRRALSLQPTPRDRFRIAQNLRQVLFEAGDLEGLRALDQP